MLRRSVRRDLRRCARLSLERCGSSCGSVPSDSALQRAPQREHTLLDEVDDIGSDSRPAIPRFPDDSIEGPGDARDAVDAGHRRASAQCVQRTNSVVVQCIGVDHVGVDEPFLEHVQMERCFLFEQCERFGIVASCIDISVTLGCGNVVDRDLVDRRGRPSRNHRRAADLSSTNSSSARPTQGRRPSP